MWIQREGRREGGKTRGREEEREGRREREREKHIFTLVEIEIENVPVSF